MTDKEVDARRAKDIDGVEAKRVGSRYVVGVVREADRLNVSIEDYFQKWKDGIKNSGLSEWLKSDVLSKIDYNSFYGLGVIVINVPRQTRLSYVDNNLYIREGSSTVPATKIPDVAELARRF